MSQLYKLLIADDHPMLSRGIKTVLEEHVQYRVVGLAEDGEEAMSIFQKWQPEIALLDIEMPKMNGIELASKLLAANPKIHVVLFTNYLSNHHIAQIKMLPIGGVLLKNGAISELVSCLNQITAGKKYFSEALKQNFQSDTLEQVASLPDFNCLTPSETGILRMIAQGLTTREIALQTSRSERTIEKHRFNIREKLNISGHNGMLHFLMEYGNQISSV